MKKTNRQTQVMNIGTSSMMVILIGLSFAVLAALAISSARSDYRLSEELATHTTDYYNASNEVQNKLTDIEALYANRDTSGNTSFAVPVNEHQELQVELHFVQDASDYEITKWKVVNVDSWEGDTNLPVLQAP